MEITASSVTRKQFTKRQRGYDTKEVSTYLDQIGTVMAGYERDLHQLASKVEQLQERLVDAKQAEEAVRLTILAASQAKEEMLSKAQVEVDRMVDAAVKDAAAVREESETVEERIAELLAEAKEQAVRIVAEAEVRAEDRLSEAATDAQERIAVARREALALLDDTRVDAEQLINAAIAEESELQIRLEELRNAIELVEGPLKAVASGAVADLENLKAAIPEPKATPAPQVTDAVSEAVAQQARTLDRVQDFEIMRPTSSRVASAQSPSPGPTDAESLMELAYAESEQLA